MKHILLGVFLLALTAGVCLADPSDLDEFRTAKETYHRNPKEAVKLFTHFLKKHRQSEWTPQAYYWLAKSLEASKADRSEVIRAYALFLRQYPKHDLRDEAAFAIAEAYRNGRKEKADLEKALDRYLKFVKEYPASDHLPEAHLKIGDLYRARKEYDKSMDAFGQVVKRFPKSPFALPAQLGIANSLYRAGKFDESVKAYLAILELRLSDTRRQDTQLALLKCYLKLGQIEKAGEQAGQIRTEADTKRFRQDYAEWETRSRLSEHYRSKGKFDTAAQELQAYLERFPQGRRAWYGRMKLGRVFREGGKPARARKEYQTVIDAGCREKKKPPVWILAGARYGIGQSYEMEKNFKAALEHYRLLLKTWPKHGWTKHVKSRVEEIEKNLKPKEPVK